MAPSGPDRNSIRAWVLVKAMNRAFFPGTGYVKYNLLDLHDRPQRAGGEGAQEPVICPNCGRRFWLGSDSRSAAKLPLDVLG